MTFDLTRYCGLCGAQLPKYEAGNTHFAVETSVYDADYTAPCLCESRTRRGKCYACTACRIERVGCGCDGAIDDGCFNCNPTKHVRPPCPGQVVQDRKVTGSDGC